MEPTDIQLDVNRNYSPLPSPMPLERPERDLLLPQPQEELLRVAKYLGDRLGQLGDEFEDEILRELREANALERELQREANLAERDGFNATVNRSLLTALEFLRENSVSASLGAGVAFVMIVWSGYQRVSPPG